MRGRWGCGAGENAPHTSDRLRSDLMKPPLILVPIVAVAVLTVAGCSADTTTPITTTDATSSAASSLQPGPASTTGLEPPLLAPSSTAGPAAAATFGPAPGTPEVVPLGTTQTLESGDHKVAITAYSLKPVDGATGLDVQVCANFDAKISSNKHWKLVDGSNNELDPMDATGGAGISPPFPYVAAAPVKANDCTRGWIVFENKDQQTIVTVRYSAGGVSSLKWTTKQST